MGISEYLQSREIPFKRLLHGPAPCATRVARSLHVPGSTVAKAVLVRSSETEGFFLAVLPATQRIDMARLQPILGSGELRLATEAELEHVFHDCELGAIPPFGTLYGVTMIVDASLAQAEEILVESNCRHVGVLLAFRDFMALENPHVARFAVPIDPARPGQPQRRAG
jgi:Ala-tRNA(Pro) deacylase